MSKSTYGITLIRISTFAALANLGYISVIIIFLPSVAYERGGFQKLDRLPKNYKICWNDLPPHQQSSHEEELH